MSNIRGIHVLSEFPCPRCKGPSVAMAVATLCGGTIIDPIEHAGGRQDCAACKTADRERETAEYNKQRARKRWIPKLSSPLPDPHKGEVKK